MSLPSWKAALAQMLHPQTAAHPTKIAIVGIGNVLSGDDAAGIAAARSLAERLDAQPAYLIVDAGTAPENFTGALRRFTPDAVLLIDAADMGEAPGTVRCLDAQDTSGISASTHSLPLHILAAYLREELGCPVALLGIQPGDLSLESPLSPPVRQAVEDVVREICTLAEEEPGSR